jgi:hypothetical protein
MTEWMFRLLGLTIRGTFTHKSKWMSRSDRIPELGMVNIPVMIVPRKVYEFGRTATSGVSVAAS